MLLLKMDAKQLRQKLRTTFGSNMTAVEELQGTRDERRRTREEQQEPNVDLLYGVAKTYGCW